jgi:SAM-dependent methyltransferase
MNLKSLANPLTLRNDVRDLLRASFEKYLSQEMVVYDVGCGDKPFAEFLKGRVKSHIGVDVEYGFYDQAHIDLVGTASKVPIPDETADAVISSQVIEHLEKPFEAFRESNRILKKNGLFFLSFPLLYPIHAPPYDYFRYTEYAVDRLLEEYGFEVLEKESIGGFWYCVGFFTGLYLQFFDRGLVKYLGIFKVAKWLVKMPFLMVHFLETKCLKMLGKSGQSQSRQWTLNYVYTARKR